MATVTDPVTAPRADDERLADLARAECVAHVGVQCLLQRSGRCNLAIGKRCTTFARTVLPKYPEIGGAYRALPQRGPGDTPEAVAHRAPEEGSCSVDPAGEPDAQGRRGREDALALVHGNGPHRRCACGGALPPRRRFCDECRDHRRRATWRRSQTALREANVVNS